MTTEQKNLPTTLDACLDSPGIAARLRQILGERAPAFASSLIAVRNSNKALQACDPRTIVAAGMMAATLDLPVNQSLGFAWIVPYGGKAQFQIGARGYVQLAQRTGLYKSILVNEVYDGELVTNNRFTGEMQFDERCRASNDIIGYAAYFKLVNGFEKWLYMSKAEVEAHAKKHSKAFNKPDGAWKTNTDDMAKKTVLKMLLSKFGPLSIQMQRAAISDQSVVEDAGSTDALDMNIEYVDGTREDAPEVSEQELMPRAKGD